MKRIALESLLVSSAEAGSLVELLERGGVAALPTETFYGLAANPWSEAGVERIFAAKGRDDGKPLPVLIAAPSDLASLGIDVAAPDRGIAGGPHAGRPDPGSPVAAAAARIDGAGHRDERQPLRRRAPLRSRPRRLLARELDRSADRRRRHTGRPSLDYRGRDPRASDPPARGSVRLASSRRASLLDSRCTCRGRCSPTWRWRSLTGQTR